MNLHQGEAVPEICFHRNSCNIKETLPLVNSRVKFYTLILLIAFFPSFKETTHQKRESNLWHRMLYGPTKPNLEELRELSAGKTSK